MTKRNAPFSPATLKRAEKTLLKVSQDFANDIHVPATALHRIQNNGALKNAWAVLFKELLTADGIQQIANESPKAERFLKKSAQDQLKTIRKIRGHRWILGRINEIERKAPFLLANVLRPFTDETHLRNSLEPVGALQTMGKLRGEQRAKAILMVYQEVCEFLYRPYLHFLVTLIWLQSDQLGKTLPDFGVALKIVEEKCRTRMVISRAAFVRNAVAHGTWTYDVEEDELALRNKNKPVLVVKPEQLAQDLGEMYSAGGEGMRAVAYYHMLRYAPSVFPMTMKKLPAALAGDESAIKQLEDKITKKTAPRLMKLRQYLEVHNPIRGT